jgi:hypothetical protein
VRILNACRLVDILAEWGSHNIEWRLGRAVTDAADAVEVALTYYAPLVGQLLTAGPRACFRAELDARDVPLLVAVNGRAPLARWAALRAQSAEHAGGYVRGMAESSESATGSLIYAFAGEVVGGEVRARSALVVFDGCHRGAAWVLRGAAGPVAASLVVTERPP